MSRAIDYIKAHPRRFYPVLLAIVSFIIILMTILSGAWLYDTQKIEVDYTVAKLSFDLSSNHMYFHYDKNPDYIDDGSLSEEQRNQKFQKVIADLIKLVADFDNGSITLGDFDNLALSTLKRVYPNDFIDRLYEISQNEETYGEEAIKLYNEYTANIEFPFKVKSVDYDFIAKDTNLIYAQVLDIISLYGDEYVVQKDADGVSSSTIAMNIKLRGGTTYKSFEKDALGNFTEPAEYFDENFNEMVLPMTLKFNNTGNVDLFLALGISFENNRDKGIIGLVMPKNFRIADATEYIVNGKTDYRKLLVSLVKAAIANADIVDLGYSDNEWDNLTYDQLYDLSEKWNTFAVASYAAEGNANGNIRVDKDELSVANEVLVDMIFWADYEKNAEYYAAQIGQTKPYDYKQWAENDIYQLLKGDFTVKIRTSLNDIDLSNDTTVDYELARNKKRDYEKFAGVSNFDVEGYAYFLQDDGSEINAINHMSGGYIIASYIDPAEQNYIGRMRFAVRYRGYSPALIRVRLIEQWTNGASEIVGITQIPFKTENNWVDNRVNDMYFYSAKEYFSTDKDVLTTTGKAKLMVVPVLQGIKVDNIIDIDSTLAINKDLTLKLTFLVEAVQPNRFEEFWKFDEIPKTDASLE